MKVFLLLSVLISSVYADDAQSLREKIQQNGINELFVEAKVTNAAIQEIRNVVQKMHEDMEKTQKVTEQVFHKTDELFKKNEQKFLQLSAEDKGTKAAIQEIKNVVEKLDQLIKTIVLDGKNSFATVNDSLRKHENNFSVLEEKLSVKEPGTKASIQEIKNVVEKLDRSIKDIKSDTEKYFNRTNELFTKDEDKFLALDQKFGKAEQYFEELKAGMLNIHNRLGHNETVVSQLQSQISQPTNAFNQC